MVAIILPGRNGPMIGGGTGGGAGGFSLLAHGIAAASASPVTPAIDTTGANLLVVAVSQYKGVSVGTLTDSKGNTWTGLTAQTGASIAYSRIYYCASPTVGSGHTFTYSNGGNVYTTLAVQAWSGANISPFDVQNGAAGSGITSLATGSVTPNQNNSLIVSGGAPTDNTTNYLIDSSFVTSDRLNCNNGVSEGLGMAYLLQGTAGAVNPTWSWTTSGQAAATIAVFKP